MLPILASKQLPDIDRQTVKQRGISFFQLLQEAASACCHTMDIPATQEDGSPLEVIVFCGRGNNGGDGYVIARLLQEQGNAVRAIDLPLGTMSAGCKQARDFAIGTDVAVSKSLRNAQFPEVPPTALVIDAVFGTGLNRPVGGELADVFGQINQLPNTVYAVDVPSGLFIDSGETGAVVAADKTFSIGYAKPAEFVPEAAAYYGKIVRVPLDLAPVSVLDEPVYANLFGGHDGQALLKGRDKYAHKGTSGHALLVAGAHGTMGAAVLSARATMRTGTGLLTCHVPDSGYQIMQISLPEAMCQTDEAKNYISEIGDTERYDAVGIGPGIGQKADTAEALRGLLFRAKRPLVIDADALNLLARHRGWWASVPRGSILTPHPKEFDRLFGEHQATLDRWATQRRQAKERGWTIVLKGAHTCVATAGGELTINNTGNPALATAGSGDVLTGILLGLLARGYAPEKAAVLGVCLHGLAGDAAVFHNGSVGIIASDIVSNIREAFVGAFGDDGR